MDQWLELQALSAKVLGSIPGGELGFHKPCGMTKKKKAPKILWDFPCGPVHGTLPSNAKDSGLIPDLGGKIPYASWPRNQNINRKNIITNSIKTLKMVCTHK